MKSPNISSMYCFQTLEHISLSTDYEKKVVFQNSKSLNNGYLTRYFAIAQLFSLYLSQWGREGGVAGMGQIIARHILFHSKGGFSSNVS